MSAESLEKLKPATVTSSTARTRCPWTFAKLSEAEAGASTEASFRISESRLRNPPGVALNPLGLPADKDTAR